MSWLVAYAVVPSFYASVERVDDPSLRARPVIVGGNPSKRGKVQSATDDALKSGVCVGMLVSEAVALCPDAIVSLTNMKRYRAVSSLLHSCMRNAIAALEADGLDAAYLELQRSDASDLTSARRFARLLCRRVREELGLPLKLGIAPLKYLARIAAQECGDEDFCFIAPGEEREFLYSLAPDRLPGVGAKTLATLRKLGVERVEDLAVLDGRLLEKELGNHGRRILALARGEDRSRVRSAPHPKSLSHGHTFSEANIDRRGVEEELARLCRNAETSLRQQDLCSGRVAIKIRYSDKKTETRSRILVRPILHSAEIFAACQRLLDRTQVGIRGVDLIGVALSHLGPQSEPDAQLDLFRG
jgi:DNA polymerase-4